MGTNGPPPEVQKFENVCSHCGRDNAGIEDKTCRGCGAVVLHRPTSPKPPRPDVRKHHPNTMSVSGIPEPPPPGITHR